MQASCTSRPGVGMRPSKSRVSPLVASTARADHPLHAAAQRPSHVQHRRAARARARRLRACRRARPSEVSSSAGVGRALGGCAPAGQAGPLHPARPGWLPQRHATRTAACGRRHLALRVTSARLRGRPSARSALLPAPERPALALPSGESLLDVAADKSQRRGYAAPRTAKSVNFASSTMPF